MSLVSLSQPLRWCGIFLRIKALETAVNDQTQKGCIENPIYIYIIHHPGIITPVLMLKGRISNGREL